MNANQKKLRLRILISFALFLLAAVLEHAAIVENQILLLLCYLIPYGLVGYDIVRKAILGIGHGQMLDENFLMLIATIGAFATNKWSEAVAVMLFYQIGELFQSIAVERSRKSISDLMDICPEYANVERNGALEQVDPDEVSVGETIVIKPGERVPLDGTVLEGNSSVDTSALTGESVPREIHVGDDIVSGCINGSGLLRVQTTREFEDSMVAKILELVENSAEKKAKTENFITRFARIYTPLVVAAAVLLAVIPPLLGQSWSVWIHRACTFLVISCPCALVISIPLGFFSGIGAASRQGVLIKGGNDLERLAQLGVLVFDKTGTLTEGVFRVTALHPVGVSEETLLELAALAESYSDHPIAKSVREAWDRPMDLERVKNIEEVAGHGVRAQIDGTTVLAGNHRLIEQAGITDLLKVSGTALHLARDGVYLGCIVISDVVKQNAKSALSALHAAGIQKTVMLTGDHTSVAEQIAAEVGIDEVHAELLPSDKVSIVEKLIDEADGRYQVGFVGDGINDAPVLSRVDIGIAMGAMGSDAAIEAADVVLMHDNLEKIPSVMRIARKTMRIVRENIVFALGVKSVVLVLGAIGAANMWIAVFADVGVCILAILNAVRTK